MLWQKVSDMKEKFFTLKNDIVFKYVMKNDKVLRGFLSSILKMDPKKIRTIEHRDTHLKVDGPHDKLGILDVRVVINGYIHINIELQMYPFKYWDNRGFYYVCRMYVNQGKRGESYDRFGPCIQISILGSTPKGGDDEFYSEGGFLNKKTYKLLSDNITFHMINLSQLQYVKDEDKDDAYDWAALIGAQSQEEYRMIAKKNEYLAEAVRETEAFNRDFALREEATRREMAIMDEIMRMKEAREEGEEEGKALILKLIDCLIKDNENDKIAEITHNIELRNELLKKYNLK